MMEDIGISLIQMMENAGLQLANLARDVFLDGDVTGKKIAVLAGAGGNGGGAVTAARRLTFWGATCDIGLSRTDRPLNDVPQRQLNILLRTSKPEFISPEDLDRGYDLIIDGLIGYSLRGIPSGRTAAFIEAANANKTSTLSLDVPSGFDGQTGISAEICTQASATLTLALPKVGMSAVSNRHTIGQRFCADISCPSQVFEDLGLQTAYQKPFDKSAIVMF